MTFVDRFLSFRFSILIVLLIHLVAWLSAFTLIDVHPETADYWVWSRYLSLGYYEHPPFIAYAIRFISLFFNDAIFGLKLGSVLFSVLLLTLGYMMAKAFFDRKTALAFVLIFTTTPFLVGKSVLWHVDQPLLAFWMIGLYALANYLRGGKANWLLLLGLATGLGGVSDYTFALFPVSLLFWLIFSPAARNVLRHWQFYAGALIAMAVIGPNVYWNWQHEWVTFIYLMERAVAGARFGVPLVTFSLFQIGLFSVIYCIYFWWLWISRQIDSSVMPGGDTNRMLLWSLLLWSGWVPFVFFSVISFLGCQVDPQWAGVVYLSFYLLLARFIVTKIDQGHGSRQVTIFFSALAINLGLVVLVLVQIHYIFIPGRMVNPPVLKSLAGWSETAEQLKELTGRRNIELPGYIISRDYQLSSPLALYMKSQPQPHTIEREQRNLWSSVSAIGQEGALLVCPNTECPDLLVEANERFAVDAGYLGEIQTIHNGQVLRKLKVFYLPPF